MATSDQEGQRTSRGLGGNQEGNPKPQTALDAKLNELKKDVFKKQEVACEKLIQKLKRDKGYQFRWKDNEAQHAFNESLADRKEETESLLETNEPAAIEKTKRTLVEGKELIAKQQKLADRSENSWKTSEEYK